MSEKPEIWFYHLERSTLDQVLPTLLEKTIERGWRAMIKSSHSHRLDEVDETLWTFRDDSFLPHGRADQPHAERQPVLLSETGENLNGAQALFIVEGADLSAVETFERCFILFDGRDDQRVQAERDRGHHGEAADVWALGAVIYFAVEGKDAYPPQGNALATLRSIAAHPPRRPERAGPLEPVLADMLSRDPARRGTMSQVLRRLEDVAAGGSGAVAGAAPTAVATAPDHGGSAPFVPGGAATEDPYRLPPRRGVGWLWVLLAAGLVALAVAAIAFAASRGDDSGSPGGSSTTTEVSTSEDPPPSESTSSQPSSSSTTTEPSSSSSRCNRARPRWARCRRR